MSLPPSEDEETDGETYSVRRFGGWSCRLYHGTTNAYVNCAIFQKGNLVISSQLYMQHIDNYAGQRWCVSASTDLTSIANQVCKSETGTDEPSTKNSGATGKVWIY